MKALIGFAGIGGPEIALREARIEAIGVEYDPAIAEVNRANGGHCLTADILDVAPVDFIGWLLFHFSPPCPSFSVASQGGETETDLALARKICEFIRVGRPLYFTLENVWGYRKSLSWHLIQYTLLEEGYGLAAWNLNSADYGVPQSRRRMIAIARRDGRQPVKPWPTHAKRPDMFAKPWRGWYEAIEDLVPDLLETRPAPWQVDRMSDELKTFLMMTGNTNRNGADNVKGRGVLEPETPANTISAGPKGGAMPRAFILGQGGRSLLKSEDGPADTVTANNNQTGIKAVILDSGNSSGQVTTREVGEPVFTVTAMGKMAPLKAFIVGGQYQSAKNNLRVVQNRQDGDPIWTICASDRLDTRIWARGRWVSMSPRCLARFQDFPDNFILPGEPGLDENIVLLSDPRSNRKIACRGIGNALPAGVYRAILRSLDLL